MHQSNSFCSAARGFAVIGAPWSMQRTSKRHSEQPSHALSGSIGIVVVFGRDERQVAVCPAHDEIRAEEHCRRVLAPEGVVGLFRPRSVDGLESTRQHLACAIPDVGLLVHRPAALGRVDLHTVRPRYRQAERWWQAAVRQMATIGSSLLSASSRSGSGSISTVPVRSETACASLSESMRSSRTCPAPDPGHYFLDGFGHRVRLAHRCLRLSLD